MDFEPDFLRHIFPRINWGALREAAAAMGERLRAASVWDSDRGSACWSRSFASWAAASLIASNVSRLPGS